MTAKGDPSRKAGCARERITPPLGTMMGFASRDREHGCEGVHDDLFTRALFVEHEGERALLMGFDLCLLGREAVADLGLLLRDLYVNGITLPLGDTNGEGLYLPTSAMMDEGGYEVVSAWEYGFPSGLARGPEAVLMRSLDEVWARGVE